MKSIFIWLITRTSWGTWLVIGNEEDTFVALFFLFMLLIWSVPLGLLWWLAGAGYAGAYVLGTLAAGALAWLGRH